MTRKSFIVLGLGKFGLSVAETLAKSGCEVIAVDIDEEKIQNIANKVTYAMRADIVEPGVLESLGMRNVDVAIIAISDNMAASIMATIFAKESGVDYVLAKAVSPLHEQILKKVGADDVILPENAMGARVAKNIISGGFIDLFEISSSFSMVELIVPKPWVGKNLLELKLRTEHGVNVVAIKEGEHVIINVDPTYRLKAEQTLTIIASNEDLLRIHQS